MSHPGEAALALYAGGELGLWSRMQMARHLRVCGRCSRVVEEFRALRDFAAAEAKELPAGLDWGALSAEMRANVRVGLAAGECVATEAPLHAAGRWRIAAFVVPVLVLVIAGWIIQTFPPAKGVRPVTQADAVVILEAGADGIGVQSDGRGFTLVHRGAENVISSVRGESAVRARYVDAETGQVTISHVYAQ